MKDPLWWDSSLSLYLPAHVYNCKFDHWSPLDLPNHTLQPRVSMFNLSFKSISQGERSIRREALSSWVSVF